MHYFTTVPLRLMRRARAAFAATMLGLLIPSLAFAADDTGLLAGILSGVLTPENIGIAITAILTAFGGFLLKWINTERRRRNVADGVKHAYAIVEDYARRDPNVNAIDKVAAGLKAIDAWMLANGWRPLNPVEQERAKLGFTELSGVQHIQQKVAAAALEKVTSAVPSEPRAS